MIKRSFSGFTLVEVLVVVVILGILIGIAVNVNNNILVETQDKQRQTSIGIVAEALEAYYNRNGVYPTLATMTNTSGSTVATSINLKEPKALIAPKASAGTTNSIVSTTTPTATQFGYAGTTCTATGCAKFTLYYRQVQDNTVKAVASRR